ncbi:permease [Planctomycetota bacterium]
MSAPILFLWFSKPLTLAPRLSTLCPMPDSFYTFAAIATAIFIEAMPFLAIGALLSAAMEVLVPADRMMRWIPKNRLAGIALGVGAGFVLPTCECGVVPVVRRLIRKGVPPHVAVAYMLAAPIVNPVVLASTWFAFQGDISMVGGRVLVAIITAGCIGLLASRMGSVLRETNKTNNCACDHDHASPHNRFVAILCHAAQEFIDMGKYLILGAIAAGFFKTFLPQSVLTVFTGSIVLQILGMMLLAILLSVCSEADAFVAASFQSFASAAQLAFITLGPMIDLKLIGMVILGQPFTRTSASSSLMAPPIPDALGIDADKYPLHELRDLYQAAQEGEILKERAFSALGTFQYIPLPDGRTQAAFMRSYMACCAADALAIGFQLTDNLETEFKAGDWVVVSGTLTQLSPPQPIPSFRLGTATFANVQMDYSLSPKAIVDYTTTLPSVTELLDTESTAVFTAALQATDHWETDLLPY